MPTTPVHVPGITGEITLQPTLWRGFKLLVDGQEVQRRRNTLMLPGANGPVEAKLKGGFRAYPTLVVGEDEYPLGPPTPVGLQGLVYLPLASFLLLRGALGGLIAGIGLFINLSIVRSQLSDVAKGVLMALTTAGTALVALVLAGVITTTLGAKDRTEAAPDQPRLTRAEFVTQANAICKAGNDEMNAEATKRFGTAEPSAEQTMRFVQDVAIPNTGKQIAAIRNLNEPEDMTTAVDTALNAADTLLAEAARDSAVFLNPEPWTDVNTRLTQLGLTTCAQ